MLHFSERSGSCMDNFFVTESCICQSLHLRLKTLNVPGEEIGEISELPLEIGVLACMLGFQCLLELRAGILELWNVLNARALLEIIVHEPAGTNYMEREGSAILAHWGKCARTLLAAPLQLGSSHLCENLDGLHDTIAILRG